MFISFKEAQWTEGPNPSITISRLLFLGILRKGKQMGPATNKISDKLKSLKASCYEAPFGEKRASALKHYYAAETAHEAKKDAKMNKELAAAKRVLGEIRLLA